MPLNYSHLFFTFLAILFFLYPSYGGNFIVTEGFTTQAIGQELTYYSDSTQNKTIEEIISIPNNLFKQNKYNQLIFKRQEADIWLKINIHNQRDSTVALVLHSTDIFTRYFNAYITKNNQLTHAYKAGVQGSFHDRVIPYRSSAFPLIIPANDKLTVYLKLAAKWDPIQFHIYLSEKDFFYKKSHREYLLLGIFHGLLILMTLLAGALTATTKTRLFLFYFLYALFISASSFCVSGMDFQYIYPNMPVIAHHSKMFIGIFSAIFLFAFVIEFYRNEKEDIQFSKNLFKIFLPLAAYSLLLIAFQDKLRIIFPNPIKLFFFIPGLFVGLVCFSVFYSLLRITYKNPNLTNVIFFIGYIGTAIYGASSIFLQNGIIQLPFDKFLIFRICVLIELACLTILMLQKIFLLQKEKLQLDTEIKTARWEKEKADKIKELDQAKTRLYTNITHEFRTPLTVIKGMTEQIDRHEEQTKIIERNSNTLLRLINQMLDLSKAEKGELKLNLVQNDIVEYIRYLSESFSSWAAAKNIQLHFSSNMETCIIDYDAEKIQDILSNLIFNAIKHTAADGHIYISIKKENSQLIISVKDEGKGIPPEHLPHVFDRFYQVDQTDTRSDVGSGIGLALCKELVGLMNGEIKVESEINKGSEFLVILPVTNNAILKPPIADSTLSAVSNNPAPKENAEIRADENAPSILVVEDNADVRNYIAYCLGHHYQILMAENGKAGIEKALEHSPDLIISDIMMPEMNGLDLCDHLKTNIITSHIPIILLTAKADHEAKIQGLRRGADAYLAKPFNKEELLVRTSSLIEQRKRIQEHFLKGNKLVKTKEHEMENGFLKSVRGVIVENIMEADFDVQRLSRTIGMSRSQLYRKVKSLTGRSIAGYVRYVRLQEGKTLLETTDKTISEIAYDVGFNDLSYFSKTFSEEFGCPPNEMRN